ncbi:MAG: T9SS type A sorting domain-containing protein, partial [Bacteroidota bacterium]
IEISRYNKEGTTLLIYPQPFVSELIVESNRLVIQVKLIDQTGKYILQLDEVLNRKIKLDMRAIPTGLYFLKIKTSDGYQFQKLIKQ